MSQSLISMRKSKTRSKFAYLARVALRESFLTADRKRFYKKGAKGNIVESPNRGFRLVEMDDAGDIYVSIKQLVEVS